MDWTMTEATETTVDMKTPEVDVQGASLFEWAAASVLGDDHKATAKNNQDAWHVAVHGEYMAGVVCDGCGSGTHSEVGAAFGARIVTTSILQRIASGASQGHDDGVWYDVWNESVRTLARLAAQMSQVGSLKEVVENHFLFTTVGFAIGPDFYNTFSVGDGHVMINGMEQSLGLFENNAPPYIGYAVFQNGGGWGTEKLKFKVSPAMPTDGLTSLMIGTDGVLDLARALHKRNEPIDFFCVNDRLFKNKDALRRRLAMLNMSTQNIDWENKTVSRNHPELPDDTTMITVRRKK